MVKFVIRFYLKMSLRNFSFGFLQQFRSTILNASRISKIHTSSALHKVEDRKEMLASLPAKDEGTAGEKSIDIDTLMGK